MIGFGKQKRLYLCLDFSNKSPFWLLDIGLLGSTLLGNLTISIYQNCMATINSSSSILDISTKSHHFFLVLLFIFFICLALVSSWSTADSETLMSGHSSTKTMKDFHARKGDTHSNPKGRDNRFEASDHEVPSGPNPISNR